MATSSEPHRHHLSTTPPPHNTTSQPHHHHATSPPHPNHTATTSQPHHIATTSQPHCHHNTPPPHLNHTATTTQPHRHYIARHTAWLQEPQDQCQVVMVTVGNRSADNRRMQTPQRVEQRCEGMKIMVIGCVIFITDIIILVIVLCKSDYEE